MLGSTWGGGGTLRVDELSVALNEIGRAKVLSDCLDSVRGSNASFHMELDLPPPLPCTDDA